MCAHLTAHAHKLQHRINDYHHIVGSLLFPPLDPSSAQEPTTIFSTSHLFFFGDLNFRIDPPPDHALARPSNGIDIARVLEQESAREDLKKYDQLLVERDQKGSAFVGFREGEFWRFKCSYKYKLGEVDKYESVTFITRLRDQYLRLLSHSQLQYQTGSCVDRQNHVHHLYRLAEYPARVSYNECAVYVYTIIYHFRSRTSRR